MWFKMVNSVFLQLPYLKVIHFKKLLFTNLI